MGIVAFASEYVSSRGLAKTPLHSANRFAKFAGDVEPGQITPEMVEKFRKQCEADGLSAWTIKGNLKDLRTLIRANGGDLKVKPVEVPESQKHPVPHEHLDAVWPLLPAWGRQFVAVSFWTSMRLADMVTLLKQGIPSDSPMLEWRAHKTKRTHRMPIPPWLRQWLGPVSHPLVNCKDHNAVLVRNMLAAASNAAGVAEIQPNHIRDAGLKAWHRADFEIGRVVHGSGLSALTLRHYVEAIDVIGPVAPRVVIPSCFRNGQEPDECENIQTLVSLLDPEARRMILDMATRLAK